MFISEVVLILPLRDSEILLNVRDIWDSFLSLGWGVASDCKGFDMDVFTDSLSGNNSIKLFEDSAFEDSAADESSIFDKLGTFFE